MLHKNIHWFIVPTLNFLNMHHNFLLLVIFNRRLVFVNADQFFFYHYSHQYKSKSLYISYTIGGFTDKISYQYFKIIWCLKHAEDNDQVHHIKKRQRK
jgi:hypothetical protein